MQIENRKIGRDSPPFIIAEMSGNHNQSLTRAMAIIEAAARSGADAIKFQTYTADTMTIDLKANEFLIDDPNSPWNGRTLYELYSQAQTPWEWHSALFGRARELGLIPFSTPFDLTAVEFLEELEVPCYKVASFENTDLPLIRKIASTGKPIIISTGLATIEELRETVRTARDAGCRDMAMLKCTSSYPAPPRQINAITIPNMRQLFDCEVGLSDHTIGIGAAAAAVALGASIIEKHLTLSRGENGVDSAFSAEPDELAQLVLETKRAWQAVGEISYGSMSAERASENFRRSIYVVENIEAGDAFTIENIRCIRPGLGLEPKYLELVLGRRASCRLARGTPLAWPMIR